jgi:hypothetical protein
MHVEEVRVAITVPNYIFLVRDTGSTVMLGTDGRGSCKPYLQDCYQPGEGGSCWWDFGVGCRVVYGP